MNHFSGKILVIEDDEAVSSVQARGLRTVGHSVQVVPCAEVAQELLKQQEYDVLLLDLQLPGMDGLSFLEEIRQQGHQEQVIIVTGFADIASAVKATKLGASNYLQKPFELNEVRREIERLLELLHEDFMVHYIREHCKEVNSRREVAGIFHLTSVTVSRQIQKKTGQSFTKFLHACRVELAQPLLEQPELTVSQIAHQVGFRTPQHFARIFHQVTGSCPSEYRKAAWGSREAPPVPPTEPFLKNSAEPGNNQTHLL